MLRDCIIPDGKKTDKVYMQALSKSGTEFTQGTLKMYVLLFIDLK